MPKLLKTYGGRYWDRTSDLLLVRPTIKLQDTEISSALHRFKGIKPRCVALIDHDFDHESFPREPRRRPVAQLSILTWLDAFAGHVELQDLHQRVLREAAYSNACTRQSRQICPGGSLQNLQNHDIRDIRMAETGPARTEH